jgi:hypothetical protein
MEQRVGVAVLALFLGGCLTGNFQYTAPQSVPVASNARVVNQSVDDVWKTLIPALGSRFFVINNLDKSSGLVNVSYSGNPEQYIDCGHIDAWVDNVRGKRSYNFAAASPMQTYEVKSGTGLYVIERRMNLDGRINIILEALDVDRTRVTANTRYVVTRQMQGRRIDLAIPYSTSDTINFGSGQAADFPDRGSGAVRCEATGRLETAILDLLPSGSQ